MSDPVAAYDADGLHRFVVTLVDQGPIPVGPAAQPGDVVDFPEGSTLVRQDGAMGYLDPSGTFVPLAVYPAGPDEIGNRMTADELAGAEGVESVTLISDGTYAVVTSTPDALDRLGISAVDDPPFGLSEEPYEPYQWALDNTGSNLATVQSPAPFQVSDADVDGTEVAGDVRGTGVVVAVVDSGVDFTHPDLVGARWVNDAEVCDNGADDDGNGFVDDCQGWDFGNEDPQPYAAGNNDHGTHVAGIIAAADDNAEGVAGLAPGVRIMDLSVEGPAGISGSSIARAIRYATDNGADVINLSLGSEPGTPLAAVQPMVEAIEHANTHGVVVVAAAGNHGIDLTSAPVYPASVDAPNVLAVGASTPAETRAGFSNYGMTVDLFAPGELILSTIPGGGYAFMSGTSQASPIAAAAAALVVGGDQGLDPAGVIAQLVGTGDEVNAYVGLAANGVRLNAARATGPEPDAAVSTGDLVTIRGLAGASLDSVDAQISLSNPGGQLNQPFHWEASLVAVTTEGVFGIIDHPVTVAGAELTTDDRGAVRIGESDTTQSALHTVLPAGTYGLVIEAVPRTDSTVRLGEAFIATFTVGDPGSGPSDPGPSDPGPSDPGPSDPGVGEPGPSEPVDDPVQVGPTQPSPNPDQPPADGPDDAPVVGQPPAGDPGSSEPPTDSSDPVEDGPSSDAPSDDTGTPGDAPSTPPPATTPDPGAGTLPETPVDTVPGCGDPGAPAPSGPGEAPAPPGVDPIDVSDGAWAVTGITPRSGFVMTETLVTITGEFPEAAFVWFGDQSGTVIVQSDTALLVATPLRAEPGPVTVGLRTRSGGLVLEIPDGFVFIEAGEQGPVQPGGDEPPTDDGGTDVPAAPDPVPDPDGPQIPADDGSGTGSDPAPTPPEDGEPGVIVEPDPPAVGPIDGPDDPDGTDAGGPNPQRQARAAILGDPVDLGNGLTGRPLGGLTQVGGVPACSSDPCRTRRITG